MHALFRTTLLPATAVAAIFATQATYGVVTTLTPGEINGLDTETASFTDGNLTLTPFIGATQATFNGNAARLGIDDQGTNANAFNDPDTDPANGNEEFLQFELASGIGLSQFAYDFSRADGPGPDDGVFISGFLADPLINFTLADAPFESTALTTSYDSSSGTVELDIPGVLFGGDNIQVNFGRPAASEGQTLMLSVLDTTQAGAQLAITSISYSDDFDQLPIFGDVDGNGLVEIADFNIIRNNFYLDGATKAEGDLTQDGLVSIADFDEWKDNFPGSGESFLPLLFSSVPEPGAACLLLFAMAPAFGRRSR